MFSGHDAPDKVLGVIPARGGSKSIERKNLAPLGGKPLISYTINQAFTSSSLDVVIVSTDSEEIANVACSLGAQVPFLRPEHLATDTASSLEVVLHALDHMENSLNCVFWAVALLQPTTPFRPPYLIDEAVRRLADSDSDSVISMVEVGANHPHRMYEIGESNILSQVISGVDDPMLARQLLPPVYIRSGDVYVTRRECLIEQRSLIGKSPSGIVIPGDSWVNIDSERDLEFARFLLESSSLELGL